MNVPKGLRYLLMDSPRFESWLRADYPSLHGVANGILPMHGALYQRRGYPLGKTRKGFSKWLTRNFKNVRMARLPNKNQRTATPK